MAKIPLKIMISSSVYFAKQGQGKNTFYVRTEKPA